jgi:hypothetical protein
MVTGLRPVQCATVTVGEDAGAEEGVAVVLAATEDVVLGAIVVEDECAPFDPLLQAATSKHMSSTKEELRFMQA